MLLPNDAAMARHSDPGIAWAADHRLDSLGQRRRSGLLRLFIELNRLGTTTVIATHDMGLVDTIEVPRLHLEAGRLVQLPPGIDPPNDLPSAPRLDDLEAGGSRRCTTPS